MHALDKTAWEVLNATADDWENLEQIYHLIGFDFCAEDDAAARGDAYCMRPSRGAPPLEQIADRICELVESGLLEARLGENGQPVSDLTNRSYTWRAWFAMTPLGRQAWEASEFSTLVEQE